MDWLKKRSGLVLIAVAGLMALTACLGKAAPTPPPAEEWLQPPKEGPGPSVAGPGQALDAEYVGRIRVEYPEPTARFAGEPGCAERFEALPYWYSDIWVLSNNTSESVAISYEVRKRDTEGILLDTHVRDLCAKGSKTFLWTCFIMVPPGESIIVHKHICPGQAEAGVTQELTAFPRVDCPLFDYWGAIPDRSVRLLSLEGPPSRLPSQPWPSDAFTAIIENSGTREGLGVAYLNVYDDEDSPIFGTIMQFDWGPEIPGIPPGEKVRLQGQSSPNCGEGWNFLRWLEPEFARYEVIFVGLSVP